MFSIMDIASGYWNVKMADNSIEKTAFTCKYGLFEWLVMPFGVCNGVATFERLMENVLADYKWRSCVVYLDDCIVFSEDFAQHLIRLDQVLNCFRLAGFKLKMSKCKWGCNSVAFLGHIVTPAGVLPNPEKVKSVLKIKPLKNIAEVRSFMGLASYFRRFVKNFASIAKPIEDLKTMILFRWSQECDEALDKLKRALTSPPILAYPDFSDKAAEFKVYTDACPIAVGAVLMQEQKGAQRVIAYASQALDATQRRWIAKDAGTSEIECYGIVWALQKFRPYLDQRHFTLYTDHAALKWLMTKTATSTNPKLSRWISQIQGYEFTVEHIPGCSNGVADGLSRLPINMITRSQGFPEPFEEDELKEEEPYQESPRTDSDMTELLGNDSVMANLPRFAPMSETFETDYALPMEEIRKLQSDDPWISALKAFLIEGAIAADDRLRKRIARTYEDYDLLQGVVVRRVIYKTPLRNPTLKLMPVIPIQLIETIIKLCHDPPLAGHFGLRRTYERVRLIGYWPGMHRDVKEYCEQCYKCGAAKGARPWKNGRLQKMPVYELKGPFSFIVVDALGPLPKTARGNQYVIIFVDYFTRYPEAFAVRDLKASTFTKLFMDQIVCRYGPPDRLLSDRGTNFVSKLAMTMYTALGIKKLSSAAGHPQSQGLVERFNGTLATLLKIYVKDSQTDWDLLLPQVIYAYRTAYQETLEDSPHYCLYGQDPKIPTSTAFRNLDPAWKSDALPQYRRQLVEHRTRVQALVTEQLKLAHDKNRVRKASQRHVSFEINDPVWIYQYFQKRRDLADKRIKKLACHWHGPYRILRQLGPNTYIVSMPNHPKQEAPINVDRMKKFNGQ
jgi:hypothetical protein